MADEMYFSSDEKALIRGKRSLRRTETCRPCLVQVDGDPNPLEAVVLDVTPYGMMIRLVDTVPVNTPVQVQLMRDDAFSDPLGVPKSGVVVRSGQPDQNGFADHGIRIDVGQIASASTQPRRVPDRPAPTPRKRPRMHTIDFTVGGEGKRGTR